MLNSKLAQVLEIAGKQRARMAEDMDRKLGAGAGDLARADQAEIEQVIMQCKLSPKGEVKIVSDITREPEVKAPK